MTDKKDVLGPSLWTPRPVNETIAVYADWADNYDAEITSRGYRTPDRLAAALSKFVPADTPILDFGCGTGIVFPFPGAVEGGDFVCSIRFGYMAVERGHGLLVEREKGGA